MPQQLSLNNLQIRLNKYPNFPSVPLRFFFCLFVTETLKVLGKTVCIVAMPPESVMETIVFVSIFALIGAEKLLISSRQVPGRLISKLMIFLSFFFFLLLF